MSWRKSWPKLNIYGKNGNGDCAKRRLLPDERSVWDDYLDLSQISPIRGKVCIAAEIGYSVDQVAKILNTPKDIIVRADKRLIKEDMISIDENRVISISKWSIYQSEYARLLQYRGTGKGTKKGTGKGYSQNSRIDTDRDTDTEVDTEKKKLNKPFLDFSYLKAPNIKALVKTYGDKEAVKRHLKGMGFYEARIIEAFEKAGI